MADGQLLDDDTLNQLGDLLSLLRKNGVTQFRMGHLELSLGEPLAAAPKTSGEHMRENNEHLAEAKPRDYTHPSLWGGKGRPAFAGGSGS